MAISSKIEQRISSQLKRYQSIISQAQQRDISEADTVVIVGDMLADVLGYDKYQNVTGQYAIRGTYVDLAVKMDDEIRFLIEVKAVGIGLKDGHVKQAIDYAANQGIEWVVLTNSKVWRVYNVHFTQPIEKTLVCEIDVLVANYRSTEVIECFGNLSREGFSKGSMADLLHEKQVTNKFAIASVLTTDAILICLRRELRRLSSGIKIDIGYLQSTLLNDVIKRDLIDSEEAKAASSVIKRLQRAAARERNKDARADQQPASGDGSVQDDEVAPQSTLQPKEKSAPPLS